MKTYLIFFILLYLNSSVFAQNDVTSVLPVKNTNAISDTIQLHEDPSAFINGVFKFKGCLDIRLETNEFTNKEYSRIGEIQKQPYQNILNLEDSVIYKPISSLQPLINEPYVFENSMISPDIPNEIICKDHTSIKIPSNAFMMPDGSEVKSEVKIIYRNVSTPEEILATGVPMIYDTAGEVQLFKTNGMFEIRAYAESQPLKLREDKKIEINIPAKNDSSSYNFYTLNDNTGQWQFSNYLFPMQQGQEYLLVKDRTKFTNRYLNLSYHYLLPNNCNTGNIDLPSLTRNYSFWDNQYAYNLKALMPRIKPDKALVKIKLNYDKCENKKGKVFFNLDYVDENYTSITARFFPELKPFKNFVFEYDGDMTTKEFRSLYKNGIYPNDCRIYYEKGDSHAILELKTDHGFIQIPIVVSKPSLRGKLISNYNFIRAYRRYSALIKTKERKFNAFINKQHRYYANYDEQVYEAVIPNKKCEENQITYKVNISVLGFFNCDQIYRMEQPMQMNNTQFTCNDTVLKGLTMAYAVDKKAGGTYFFPYDKITLSLKNSAGIILKDSAGVVYTCVGKSLRKQIMYKRKLNQATIKVAKMSKVDNAAGLLSKLD